MLPAEDAHFRVRLWHGLAIELRSGLCEGWGNETRPDVLVVDDYPEIAKKIAHVFERAGFCTSCAFGGREGLAAFNAALSDGAPFSAVVTAAIGAIDGDRARPQGAHDQLSARLGRRVPLGIR